MAGASFMIMGGGPFVMGTQTGTAALQSGVSVNFPSGGTTDNTIVVVAAVNNASPVTWTPGASIERLDMGAAPSMFVGTMVDGGAGSEGLTASASCDLLGALSIRINGGAYHSVGASASVTANGTLTAPGFTAPTGMVLAIYTCDQTGGGASFTAPSGFATVHNAYVGGVLIGVFSKAVLAGATGGIDTTVSGLAGGTAAGVLLGIA